MLADDDDINGVMLADDDDTNDVMLAGGADPAMCSTLQPRGGRRAHLGGDQAACGSYTGVRLAVTLTVLFLANQIMQYEISFNVFSHSGAALSIPFSLFPLPCFPADHKPDR